VYPFSCVNILVVRCIMFAGGQSGSLSFPFFSALFLFSFS